MTTARRLLFLPGASADPAFWRPVGDRLPAQWEKLYVAWPGVAAQPPDPAVQSFADLISLAERSLGAGADVLAQSMGGVVAVSIALCNPAKVRRLVLVATSGGVDAMRAVAYDWRPDYRRQFPRAAAWMADATADLTAELLNVRCPTLLLWGDRDVISPRMLIDTTIGGQQRKVVAQFTRGGFFYEWDRASGGFIQAEPYTFVNWTRGIDPKTGKPLEYNPNAGRPT